MRNCPGGTLTPGLLSLSLGRARYAFSAPRSRAARSASRTLPSAFYHSPVHPMLFLSLYPSVYGPCNHNLTPQTSNSRLLPSDFGLLSSVRIIPCIPRHTALARSLSNSNPRRSRPRRPPIFTPCRSMCDRFRSLATTRPSGLQAPYSLSRPRRTRARS
ncbi:hypothetical protein EDB84DRAFT_1479223 [Lactarius hengduanensis]|nr:hypothetical protein EDB84DRAFT_1479223 [Lactarius hengduanensis]